MSILSRNSTLSRAKIGRALFRALPSLLVALAGLAMSTSLACAGSSHTCQPSSVPSAPSASFEHPSSAERRPPPPQLDRCARGAPASNAVLATVNDLLHSPNEYAGKRVRVWGLVRLGFDATSITDPETGEYLWLGLDIPTYYTLRSCAPAIGVVEGLFTTDSSVLPRHFTGAIAPVTYFRAQCALPAEAVHSRPPRR